MVELRAEDDLEFRLITGRRGEKVVQKHFKKGKMSGKFNLLVITRVLHRNMFRPGQFEKTKNVLDDGFYYHCNNW